MDPTNNTLTNIQIGDIICHVENYSNGYKKEVYGLAIGERIHGGRRMIKVKWFDDFRDSWHLDPDLDPPYRVKNFFVVSKAARGKANDN
jgi:hypothetical protein|tara:strand:+ start:742 stop:1008 length:267 start_codon:yes stop_codon:yes gene_type:complete